MIMMKKLFSMISLVLALTMTGSILASCNKPSENETNQTTETEKTDFTETGSAETVETEGKTDSTESGSQTETETETEPIEGPELEGEFASTIKYANEIANSVQAYYVEDDRLDYRVENQNMTLDYSLSANEGQQMVSSIKNTKGKSYVENTMDVFVTMKNGNTYYASSSTASTRPNIYRLGYYYYDVHLLEQNFIGDIEVLAEKSFDMKYFLGNRDVEKQMIGRDKVGYTVTGSDPFIYYTNSKTDGRYFFSAYEYNAIQISVKSSLSTKGELYIVAGSSTEQNSKQKTGFSIESDGEWHTYTIILTDIPDYTDKVTGFRFDIGTVVGEYIEVKDFKAININKNYPNIVLDRTLHTYPDKMNQVLHFAAKEKTTDIEALGMITNISEDTVEKIVVKDASGLHYALDGVDWNTAEYIGFDIKDVGIFGYILLAHENSGNLDVVLEDGTYIITQSSAPKNGTIIPPDAKNTYTDNDFYMGQRIYTDEYHTFDKFLEEAEYERNPMKSITGSSYVGYDALRGAYQYNIGGTGFNEPFFNSWNKHYTTEITVKGGKTDRNIYIYTLFADGGCGEGAAILDSNDMLLPIPVMIYKNFDFEMEEPVFDAGDHAYTETFFPLVVSAGERVSLKVLNLYQNWGAFPLKQLSSIQYYQPYYHLSVGTTETSCIAPWYVIRDLWTLPDFRSISMPYWYELEGIAYSNQPQHTHGGYQYFLQYTDAEGNHYATENIHNDIDSSGPVYAEVTMDYISDDGKIKVSYTHLEYAQTDELRACYEIEYEILEEVKIADFRNDFSFYSFEGNPGNYRKMGYLDENNKIVHKDVNASDTPEIIKLGKNCPYVAMYDLYTNEESWKENNVNLGFAIHSSEFILDGKKLDEHFVVVGANSVYSLSLDLDEVTLKPGDTLKINMIITPWGWYNSTDDSNMQRIRENSCVDPFTCDVIDGEKIESPFIPRILSTNGKSTEFTVSGGANNFAVRVYGFEKLTAPKIYEKIDGKWQEYVVCSINNPDKMNNMHYYDGYNVYYDGNGTYSYAFTVNMDEAESRTFKVVADEDFTPWPEIQVPESNDPINVYLDPEELNLAATSNTGLGNVVVSDDGSYIRFYGNGDLHEAYFNVYSPTEEEPAGQYLVIKYRIPTTNSEIAKFQIFTSTENSFALEADNFLINGLVKDGDWHIVVADITKQNIPTFKASATGEYFPKYLRFDIFNTVMSTESYIDIEYIGISDSLEDICALNDNHGKADISECGKLVGSLDFATGEISGSSSGTTTVEIPENLVDPASGFTKSETPYISSIDFINGKGDEDEGSPQYENKGGNFLKGPELFNYNGDTVDESILAFAGWTMIYEGIDKYMWSADDGKTWHECITYNLDTIFDAYNAIIDATNSTFKNYDPNYDASQYAYKSVYQGSHNTPSGVAAKLDAYIGQTVNVVYAAVPKNDPDGLCLIAYVTNVRVYASNADAASAEN